MTQQVTDVMDRVDMTTQAARTARFSPRLRAALEANGGGAWMREASLTLALAAQAHIELDESVLIYSDVRDLMGLQRTLRTASASSQRAGVCAILRSAMRR